MRVGKTVVTEHYHTHSYTPIVTDPTCTATGYTTYLCACSHSYTADETAALGHSYTSTVTPPTATEQGYTEHTCTRCGDSYRDNYTSHVHSYTSEILIYSDCYEDGLMSYTCDCGHSYTEVIPAEHCPCIFVEEVDPTCTEAGYDVYRCDVCNDAYTIDYPPEHTWSEGGLTFWCTVCGYGYPGADFWSLRNGSTLESTVTQTYSYVYNGSSLSQMTVTTLTASPDGLETTTTTDTLNFFYSASGDPLYVDYNGTPYYYAANLQGYLEL